MAVLTNTMMQGASAVEDEEDYQISKSLRFNPYPDYSRLNRGGHRGNRNCWTYSTWIKPSDTRQTTYQMRLLAADGAQTVGTGTDNRMHFQLTNEGSFNIGDGANNYFLSSNGGKYFNDCNAWYHVVLAVDTNRVEDTERLIGWINGKIVIFNGDGGSTVAQGTSLALLKEGLEMDIGRGENGYSDQLLAETYLIDGMQLNPAAFGKFNDKGLWVPRAFKVPTPNNGTTWSSTVTTGGASLYSNSFAPSSGKATNLFNSDGIQYGSFTDGPDNSTAIVTWKPPSDITADCSIRIGLMKLEYVAGATFTINGVDLVDDLFDQTGVAMDGTSATVKWYTAPERTIKAATGITWAKYSGDKEIIVSAIEVDGVLLRDGITDVSTRNNINDGTIWSGRWSATAGAVDGSNDFTKSFDGKATTFTQGGNDSILKWVPATTITAEKGIELFMYLKGSVQGQNDFKVNNVSKFNDAIAELGDYQIGWYDIGKTIDSTNGIQIGQDNNDDNTCFVYAIRVDGCVLIDGAHDNSFWLKYTDNGNVGRNFIGNKGIDDDTVNGALPIYNTTADSDGYDNGQTKGSGNRTDSNSSDLVFALPGDVINGDISSSPHTVTANGNAALSTANSRFYGTSIYFDGTGDYLSLSNSADFALGTGNFTVEFWIYPTSNTNNRCLMDFRKETGGGEVNGFSIVVDGNHAIYMYVGGYAISSLNNTVPNGRWYHVAVVRSATDVTKMYVDGKQVGSTYTTNRDYSDQDWLIGADENGDEGWAGYMQDIRLYKGTAKYTSDFVVPHKHDWVPTGLNASDSYDLGSDTSVDTPTPYLPTGGNDSLGGVTRGNYARLDPWTFCKHTWGGIIPLYEGNLKALAYSMTYGQMFGSIIVSNSGKWYFEVTLTGSATSHIGSLGVADPRRMWRLTNIDVETGSYSYYDNGDQYLNGAHSAAGLGAWAVNDVIGVKLDLDASPKTVQFLRNNSSEVTMNIANGSQEFVPYWYDYTNNNESSTLHGHFNFGERAFKYAQTGYSTWCTTNLPDTFSGAQLNDPSKYFDVKTWYGTGASNAITGLGFQPDLVWIKSRSDSDDHTLFDANRGVTKRLTPHGNHAESTEAQELTAFNSDGFTVGTDDAVNEDGDKIVGWCWDAGTAGAANNDGSINVTNQWVNATAGFSITKFVSNNTSGATVGHGLGVAPEFIIVKNTETTSNWGIYHRGMGNTHTFWLDLDNAQADDASAWNDTSPTNTVFSLGNGNTVNNASSHEYMAYCWTSIPGFSRFGTYKGNGQASGPAITCGFRPKLVIYKRMTGSREWMLIDSERGTFNGRMPFVYVDINNAEGENSDHRHYLKSNGFQFKTTHNSANANGETYIYAAWAENPFKNARAR